LLWFRRWRFDMSGLLAVYVTRQRGRQVRGEAKHRDDPLAGGDPRLDVALHQPGRSASGPNHQSSSYPPGGVSVRTYSVRLADKSSPDDQRAHRPDPDLARSPARRRAANLALKGSSVHTQPPGSLGDVATTIGEDALEVLVFNALGRGQIIAAVRGDAE